MIIKVSSIVDFLDSSLPWSDKLGGNTLRPLRLKFPKSHKVHTKSHKVIFHSVLCAFLVFFVVRSSIVILCELSVPIAIGIASFAVKHILKVV